MLWAEGAISPIFEEFEATRSLLACDIGDKEGRQKILSNPNYIKRFEKIGMTRKLCQRFNGLKSNGDRFLSCTRMVW